MAEKSYGYNGGGILFPLFLVFLVLKLTETINWSWWWVTAPLWVFPALIFGLMLLFGFAGAVVGLSDKHVKKVRVRQREAVKTTLRARKLRKPDDIDKAWDDA